MISAFGVEHAEIVSKAATHLMIAGGRHACGGGNMSDPEVSTRGYKRVSCARCKRSRAYKKVAGRYGKSDES